MNINIFTFIAVLTLSFGDVLAVKGSEFVFKKPFPRQPRKNKGKNGIYSRVQSSKVNENLREMVGFSEAQLKAKFNIFKLKCLDANFDVFKQLIVREQQAEKLEDLSK